MTLMERFIQNKKKYLAAMVLTALVSSVSVGVQAADDSIKKGAAGEQVAIIEKKPAVPVKITADHLRYGYADGTVEAKGNVIVVDGDQTMETDYLYGNNKEQIYFAPNTMTYVTPTMDVKGHNMTFNGILKEGTIAKGEGFFSNKYYIRGRDIKLSTDTKQQEGAIDVGMITTKHAMAWKNSPDYRMEGQDITIVPNEYITIKEAKLYIRHWHIATLKSYTTKIGKAAAEQGSSLFSLIPMPHYNSDSGFGFRASVYKPIGHEGTAFFKYSWYNKSGFKPDIGYRHSLPWGKATISYSKEKNVDHDYWVTKAPELRVQTKAYPILTDKLKLSGEFTIGYWKEGNTVKGMHHKERAQLNYGPLPFGKKLNTYATVGYERDYYAYNKALRNNFYWNVRGEYKLMKDVKTYLGYYDNKHENDSPYRFDKIDDNNYLLYGASWKIDRMNSVGVSYKYSFNRHEVTQQKIHYTRDLHSMIGRFSYDVKDHSFKFKIDFKDFDISL